MSKFLDNLIDIAARYPRKNYLLAQELGVSREHLSRLLQGENPSPTLEILVGKVHKELLTKSDAISIEPVAFSPNVEGLLQEWTSELGVSREEFLEQCLRRFGQQTRDALIRAPARKSLANEPNLEKVYEVADAVIRESIAVVREQQSQSVSPKRETDEHTETEQRTKRGVQKDSTRQTAPTKGIPNEPKK